MLPCVLFGSCYTPSIGSTYLLIHLHLFNIKQVKIQAMSNIIGDFNARLENVAHELPVRAELPDCEHCCYHNIPHPVDRPNDNACILPTMCVHMKFIVINNLKFGNKEFVSKLA